MGHSMRLKLTGIGLFVEQKNQTNEFGKKSNE